MTKKHFFRSVFLISFFFLSLTSSFETWGMDSKRPGEAAELPQKAKKPRALDAAAAAASEDVEKSVSPLVLRDQRFARATLDTSFKHMLMDDEDRAPLLSFLTAFTDINVVSVNHYTSALPVLRRDLDEKQTFLDLACHDDKGRYFLVEVQVKEQKYWNPRALYYAAGVYSQQLNEGAPWKALEPVIALNILDHDRETLPPGHFKRDFQLLDRAHLSELKEGIDIKDPNQIPYLRIIQCEIPRADLSTMPDCLLRQWLQLLKESGSLREIPAGVAEPVRKAYERLEFKRWGSQLVKDYEKDVLHLEEYEDVLARKHLEGKNEGKKEIALALLAQNVDVSIITNATGFSIEEIETLRNSTDEP